MVPGIWYQVTWYQVPGTWYQEPGTWYPGYQEPGLVPGTWYQCTWNLVLIAGTWYLVPVYLGPGSRNLVLMPGTRYQIPGIWPGTWYQWYLVHVCISRFLGLFPISEIQNPAKAASGDVLEMKSMPRTDTEERALHFVNSY